MESHLFLFDLKHHNKISRACGRNSITKQIQNWSTSLSILSRLYLLHSEQESRIVASVSKDSTIFSSQRSFILSSSRVF